MSTTPSDMGSYMKDYRAKNPDYAQRNLAQNRARRRALGLLAKKFPEEFAKLYKKELKKENVA